MKVLNFYNVKGGCGKSSLSFLAAKFLSAQGHRTLLIDLDPQCSLSKSFQPEEPEKSVLNFLFHGEALADCIVNIDDMLSLIPAAIELLKIQSSVNQNKFKKGLKSLQGYEYAIMDNAPSYNQLITSGIYASDRVIIPALVSAFDLQEVAFVLREIPEINPEAKTSIVLNRVHNAEKPTKDELEYIELFDDKFSDHLLETRIPNSLLVRRVIDRGEMLTGKTKSKTTFRNLFGAFMCEITERNDFQSEVF
jgi:chromosome partitioning protein